MNNTLVIVVKRGMVQEVYSLNPCQTEIEIIDLDLEREAPAVAEEAEARVQIIEQYLCKIY